MTRKRWFSMVALAAALTLVVAACGQKSGVHVASSGGGDSELTDEEGNPVPVDEEGNPVPVDEEGNPVAVDEEGNPVDGGDGGGDDTTGSGPGRTTSTTTKSGTPTGKAWGKTITIGIHAPITGAAPLPSTFQAAATFVRDYYNAKGGIHGRTLDIQIVDDQYQPAVATQRCSELVKQRNAFLLIGAAGTDQIQACARYAATVGVPYLSAGVTEKGLTRLKNYFAISMSYKAQVPYLVKYMRETFASLTTDQSKMYMVYSDTPNFGDAVAAWKSELPEAKTIKLSRVPSQSELNAAARTLCDPTTQARIAFPLMAPKDWLVLVGQQTCTFQWSGVGVTMGINEIAKNGCRPGISERFNGSTFFTPFPGIDRAQAMDAEFKAGTQGKNWDDIWVALWGTTKGMVMLLDRVGPELTRAKFVSTMESTTNLATGVGPVLSYSPTDHFGAKQVHVLKANCAKGTYDTPTIFLEY